MISTPLMKSVGEDEIEVDLVMVMQRDELGEEARVWILVAKVRVERRWEE